MANRLRVALRSSENRYVSDLKGLFRGIHRAYSRELENGLAHLSGTPTKDSLVEDGWFRDLLAHLLATIQAQISKKVGPLFDRMASSVLKASAGPSKDMGITPSMAGVTEVLREARNANIELVEQAHRDYAAQVREVFDKEASFGLRVEELKKLLLERSSVSESRAELIARDQTLKTNGKINEARQLAAGVSQYTWSTSLDERVRPTHVELEGQVCDWSEPPAEFGHPGEDYQCRCIAIPFIPDFETDQPIDDDTVIEIT